MEKEFLVRQIIAAIFFKRCMNGEEEISLKMKDIMEYAPKLEEMLNNEKLGSELFVKTPVEETYDEFRCFLVSNMVGMKFGYLTDKYDKIVLTVNEYFITKYLNNMSEYQDIINKGYDLLIEESDLYLNEKQIVKVKGSNNG